MNQIFLVGRIGREPELKYTPQGSAVLEFSLATWNGKDKDSTWHNVSVWAEQAERLSKVLGKGAHVTVVGKQDNQKYQDKEGKNRYKSRVIARSVYYDPSVYNNEKQQERSVVPVPQMSKETSFTADDIPF